MLSSSLLVMSLSLSSWSRTQGLLKGGGDFGRLRRVPAAQDMPVRAHQVEAARLGTVQVEQPARVIPRRHAGEIRSKVLGEGNKLERHGTAGQAGAQILPLCGNRPVLGEIEGREPGSDEVRQIGFPHLAVLNNGDRAFEQDTAGPRPGLEFGRALSRAVER